MSVEKLTTAITSEIDQLIFNIFSTSSCSVNDTLSMNCSPEILICWGDEIKAGVN